MYMFQLLAFQYLLFERRLSHDATLDFKKLLVIILCSTISLFLSRWCHIDASNVILNLTTAEYIYLVFANVVSQVKISSRLSINILMTWSASIWRRCDFHCSFMFSWTSRTCTFDFNFIIKFSIHRLIIMLNLFDFHMKCVNSYFFEMNVTSWIQAYVVQMLCALLNVSQINSMNLS